MRAARLVEPRESTLVAACNRGQEPGQFVGIGHGRWAGIIGRAAGRGSLPAAASFDHSQIEQALASRGLRGARYTRCWNPPLFFSPMEGRYPATRLRRLRQAPFSRALVRETRLDPAQLIQPLFVAEGERCGA